MLAKLLKAYLLPTVWIPPAAQRHIRELLSHRGRLVRQRTAVINELRAVYAKRNIDPAAKLQRAQPIVSGAEDLSGYGPRIVEEDLKLLEFINRQIGGLDKELIKIALEDAQAKRLMTIVGVGAVSAVAISCWIGEIARFSNAKKLASYFGLAPQVRQSGDTERHGHITKEGNRMVRMLLIQAALVHTRRGKGPSRKHYLGVVKRRGKQIAPVAVAYKLIGAYVSHDEYKALTIRSSSGVAARSEPVLFHGRKTVLLIGQLCLSRGRIAGFKIMRFEKARRDEWVATRTLIRPANGIEKGDT